MRFIVDAQLPPTLAHGLTEQGHEAKHVVDLGLQTANNGEIWEHALRTSSVIVTKDSDFFYRRIITEQGTTIVGVRLGNTRRRQLLARFEVAVPGRIAAFNKGETLIELV